MDEHSVDDELVAQLMMLQECPLLLVLRDVVMDEHSVANEFAAQQKRPPGLRHPQSSSQWPRGRT
jgi:hypothetical protein